jgi:invasion protein IalB
MRPTPLAAWTLAALWVLAVEVRADAQPAAPAEPASIPTAAAAATAQPTSRGTEAVAEERAEQDRMICKKATETGTLGRKKKVCMTAEQWEAHRQAARSTMRSIDNSAGTQNSGVPGGG